MHLSFPTQSCQFCPLDFDLEALFLQLIMSFTMMLKSNVCYA